MAIELPTESPDNRRIQPAVPAAMTLPELLAMVAGFSLSCALFRQSVERAMERPSVGGAIVMVLAILWLGVSVSGPCVIFVRRFVLRDGRRMSEGEWIWTVLGCTWLTVGLQQQIEALQSLSAVSLALGGVTGEFASLGILWIWLSRRRRRSRIRGTNWSDLAGIACAATWPVAWVLVAVQLRS